MQPKEIKAFSAIMKKNYRSNNTYLIEGNAGDNPKLMAQSLSDGRDSLYLEFYLGYSIAESKNGNTYKKINRRTERLGLYLWQSPRSTDERNQNKETLILAKQIRFEKSQEILESTEGYRLKKDKIKDLYVFMQSYIDLYTKKDINVMKMAQRRFIEFINSDKSRYKQFSTILPPNQLTREMIVDFSEYLQSISKGCGAHTTFARFKKIIKAAFKAEVIKKNPCDGVIVRVDSNTLRKDILSTEEMMQLISTPFPGVNQNIRNAFIFCLYCGLRWCDVKDLTFANVDFSNRVLKFEQNKTKGHSSSSSVVIPLNDGIIKLIGHGERDDIIFPLPSHTMCLKALRNWVGKAGIDKHITWHCARHSFAVNILNNGANIKTVASLLGHSGLRETEKYTRAVDSLKEAAINSLPELKL